jgi:hypothetical protein
MATHLIPKDHRELLESLLDAHVEFLVVGAHALAAHGIVRATKDLDVWIRPDAANVTRLRRALAAFGAPRHLIEAFPIDDTEVVVQIGLPPNRVDLLSGISGADFGDAWANRLEATLDGIRLPILGYRELRANKRASGRPKDLLDLKALDRHRPNDG